MGTNWWGIVTQKCFILRKALFTDNSYIKTQKSHISSFVMWPKLSKEIPCLQNRAPQRGAAGFTYAAETKKYWSALKSMHAVTYFHQRVVHGNVRTSLQRRSHKDELLQVCWQGMCLSCYLFCSGKGKNSGSEGTQAALEIDVNDKDLVGVAGTLIQQLDTSSSCWFVI